jgi:large-conductance mechanosensitive channel
MPKHPAIAVLAYDAVIKSLLNFMTIAFFVSCWENAEST